MKITKDYLKELIKEELKEVSTQSAPINPFTELNKAKEAFKRAMELCNTRYSSEEYKRLSKIKEEILNALVACDILLNSLNGFIGAD